MTDDQPVATGDTDMNGICGKIYYVIQLLLKKLSIIVKKYIFDLRFSLPDVWLINSEVQL